MELDYIHQELIKAKLDPSMHEMFENFREAFSILHNVEFGEINQPYWWSLLLKTKRREIPTGTLIYELTPNLTYEIPELTELKPHVEQIRVFSDMRTLFEVYESVRKTTDTRMFIALNELDSLFLIY